MDDRMTFSLKGVDYTVPGLSVWEFEQFQRLYAGRTPEELQSNPFEVATGLLTLLFDSGDLLPENLKEAEFSKQRRWVSRLIGLDDLDGVASVLADGMPAKLKAQMEAFLGKAQPAE